MLFRKFSLFIFSVLLTTSAAQAQNPSTLWSQSFGDSGIQKAQYVAIDGSNNIIITGYFAGSVDFGGGALASAGSYDIFLAKFDSGGNHLWSQRFGDSDDQRAYSVATDAFDNIIVTGRLQGSADFGGGALTSAGFTEAFLVKFDSNGNHIWSQSFGGSSGVSANCVTVDGSNNVFLTGDFGGSAIFGSDTLASVGDVDIFLLKIAPDGDQVWNHRFGESGRSFAHGLATDDLGNVIVAGYFTGSVDFGGGTFFCAGNYDICIAKFDPDGNHFWSKRFGDSSIHQAFAVTSDGARNVIVTGEISGTADFGGGPLTSAGSLDIFMVKFDAYGNHLWSKLFGDSQPQLCRNVAVDLMDNIVITGAFNGTTDFGGGSLMSTGSTDIYVAKLDGDGDYTWAARYGNLSFQQSTGIAVDYSDNVIVTGYFDGYLNFGDVVLTSVDVYDIFLANLGPSVVTAVYERPVECPLRIQAYPNPFNPVTTITYFVPEDGMVSVRVYDANGRLVNILVSEPEAMGEHAVTWNARNHRGNLLASGAYFVRLETGGQISTQKILLLK